MHEFSSVMKIWDALGLIAKETRLLASIVIAFVSIFLISLMKLPNEDVYGALWISAIFLITAFGAFFFLYYKLATLPLGYSDAIIGTWFYHGYSSIENHRKRIAGECRIERSFNFINIKGLRTLTFNDLDQCEKCEKRKRLCGECTQTLGSKEAFEDMHKCGSCEGRKEMCQDCNLEIAEPKEVLKVYDSSIYGWRSTWAAVTNDSRLRFDYQFDLKKHGYSQRGYCVLDIRLNAADSDKCDIMEGILLVFPPHGVPGYISFRKC